MLAWMMFNKHKQRDKGRREMIRKNKEQLKTTAINTLNSPPNVNTNSRISWKFVYIHTSIHKYCAVDEQIWKLVI